MINIVKGNIAYLNQRQVKAEIDARQLQETSGLTTTSLLKMIDSRSLINSPITREAVRNSVRIWGTNEGHLEGKSTRTKSNPVTTDEDVITPHYTKI